MNKAILVGNLGSDPELRYTQGGEPVANFSLATNKKWKSKSGESQEHTEWHKIVVWGKTAENCEKFLKKGSKVLVEGEIQTREWEDKEGGKRYTTEIKALGVDFLSTSSDSGSGGGRQKRQAPEQPVEFNNDDLPF